MANVLEVNQQFLKAKTNEPDTFGITQQKPKFPQYAVVSKRRESFKTWPDYLPLQPEILVEAGLVYTGVGDSVRCFYCGGGLRNWEREDNPWAEHAKWYPSCPHVLLVKGQNYVDKVNKGELMEEDSSQQAKPQVTESNLLDTVAAQSCVQMGYAEALVKKAIDIYIGKKGNTNFKGQDLCEILFDLEDDVSHMEVTTSTVAENVTDSQANDCEVDECESDVEDEEIHESVEELYEENRRLKENQMCKICLDDVASVIFLPCGHMVSCPQCAPALIKCPICRLSIKGFVKAYFATN